MNQQRQESRVRLDITIWTRYDFGNYALRLTICNHHMSSINIYNNHRYLFAYTIIIYPVIFQHLRVCITFSQTVIPKSHINVIIPNKIMIEYHV